MLYYIMGSYFTKEKFKDVTESSSKEDEDKMLMDQYQYITPIEQRYIDDIKLHKQNYNYENLVLSGGSVRAIAYGGCLEILKSKGILKKIKRYAGTSAGSIYATFLALDYSIDDIINIIDHEKFSKFQDNHNIGSEIVNIVSHLGASTGNYFISFMQEHIKNKTGNPDFTFNDLKKLNGKELVIVSTNLSLNNTMYFSYLTHPDMPIANACRMSMSIPIIFEPVEHDCCKFVDGGVLDNFSLNVFDGKYPGDPQAYTNQVPPNPKTLGLRLTDSDSKTLTNKGKKAIINNDKDLILQLINTMYEQGEKKYMRPSFWFRTINIQTEDIPITQFNISMLQKERLICEGRCAVRQFFK